MSADGAIVIGGGIVGASCALHLAEAGVTEVRIIERDAPASKASGRAAGHLTVYGGGEFGPEVSAYCRDFHEGIADDHDAVRIRRAPLYLIAHTDEGADRLRRRHEEAEVPSELLSPAELGEREPDLAADEATAALTFGDGAHTDPHAVTTAIHDEAAEAGAELRSNEAVVDLRETDGGIAVETEEGRYEAPAVVGATGAWTPRLARMLGIEVPLLPRTSQIAMLDPPDPVRIPMYSCPDLGIYGRQDPNGEVLVGGGASTVIDDPDDFSTDAREDYLQEVAEVAPRLSAALSDVEVVNHWAGRCSATPGRHPLIGETEVPGFYLCAGFNGEGISHSPFAGRLLADLVTGREPAFDPVPFDPRGFETDAFDLRNAIDW